MNELAPAPLKSPPAPIDAPLGWLRSEIDRLFDDFRRPMRSVFNFGASEFGPIPAIEMSEHEKDYRLTAELPGLKDDDIEIDVGLHAQRLDVARVLRQLSADCNCPGRAIGPQVWIPGRRKSIRCLWDAQPIDHTVHGNCCAGASVIALLV